MRKPLLTDEMIREANRRQKKREFGYYAPDQEEWLDDEYDEGYDEEYASDFDEWDEEYQGYQEGQTMRIPVEQSIVKSRRIETSKKEAFRSKVNKILFWVIVLVIVFLLAVLYL